MEAAGLGRVLPGGGVMSKEMLDLIAEASRAVEAAQSQEAARSTCPTHGKTQKS